MPKSKKLDTKAYHSLVTSGALWGLAPLFYKQSLAVVGMVLFLAIRFSLGATMLYASERKKFVKLSLKMLLIVIVFAIFDTLIVNLVYSFGIQRTTILHASMIGLIGPFLVYFLAAVMLKEKPHRIVIIGGLIAVFGLAIVIFSSTQDVSTSSQALLGDAVLLVNVLIGAFTIIFARKILSKKKSIPPEQLGFIEYAVSAIPLVILVVASGSWQAVPTIAITTWGWIAAATVISGVIPVIMYYRSAKRLRAERLADITFISPVVASCVGVVFLGEKLSTGFVIGTSLVVVGLLVSHKKIHPILVAHNLGSNVKTLQSIFRTPKQAYQYIAVEARNTFR